MSLDFSLIDPNPTTERCECARCGHEHTAVRAEELASFNITHNLNSMAKEAGIYMVLWRPEECDPPITTAAQCIPILKAGLADLRARPDHFRQYDAPNGWGTYKDFVPWVARVLAACREHPEALVRASR